MNSSPETLGKRLLDLREEKKILQKELASHLNVTVATISNYENGVHSPDLWTLCKLADFYNVSTDYLLQRTKYRKGLDSLNKKIGVDYTVSDLINTTLELPAKELKAFIVVTEALGKK